MWKVIQVPGSNRGWYRQAPVAFAQRHFGPVAHVGMAYFDLSPGVDEPGCNVLRHTLSVHYANVLRSKSGCDRGILLWRCVSIALQTRWHWVPGKGTNDTHVFRTKHCIKFICKLGALSWSGKWNSFFLSSIFQTNCLACCVVHAPFGFDLTPEICTRPVPNAMKKSTYNVCNLMVSTVKKSVVRICCL